MYLYQQLKNPLTDETIKKIIEGYAEHYSLYNALTRNFVDQKVKKYVNTKERDELYTYIFQEWKRSILYLVKNNYIKDEYKKEGHLLASYLESVNPTTYKEIIDIMDGYSVKSEALEKAISSFAWSRVGEFSGWEHIHSNYIYPGMAPVKHIRHRLYINCDSTVAHRLILKFMKKCKAEKTPYYFKFDDLGARDDTIVIYCDPKHIGKYVKYLREIREEEQLQTNLHQPPILTSPIDGWIGYGSEPNQKDTSFNAVREKHLEKCIQDESSEWIMRNLDSKFKLNGKPTSYRDYLLNGIIKTIIKKARDYTGQGENYKKYNGYDKNDVMTKEFEQVVRREVLRHADEYIAYFKRNKLTQKLEIPFKQGKLQVYSSMLETARKKQVVFMEAHSKRFRDGLKDRIIRTANRYGIDRDNYAVDTYVTEELGKQTRKVVARIKPEPTIREDVTYHVAPKDSSGIIYHAMTEEEIRESRRKLGI